MKKIDYKDEITQMVENIKNQDVLEYLYLFIKMFLEKYE